jgi:hypothetical protein
MQHNHEKLLRVEGTVTVLKFRSKDMDGGQVRVYSKALVEENWEEMLKAG